MKLQKKQLDSFFLKTSEGLTKSTKIFLTGGVASWLMGGNRPTEDIDFALKSDDWKAADEHIQKIREELKVKVEYSEDISRWGMIGYSDFEKKAQLYKKFGLLSVFILEATIWSVGKIHRCLETDVSDIVTVFKSQKVQPDQAIETWAKAFLESRSSSEKWFFVKKVDFFLQTNGPEIWGKKFDVKKYSERFRKKIGLKTRPSPSNPPKSY